MDGLDQTYWTSSILTPKNDDLFTGEFIAHITYEYNAPINYKMISEFWDDQIGLKYNQHYVWHSKKGVDLCEEDLINQKAENFATELQYTMKFFNSSANQTNGEHDNLALKTMQKFMNYTKNTITFAKNTTLYSMDLNEDESFDIQLVDKKADTQQKTFILDNDDDPLNDSMYMFQKF